MSRMLKSLELRGLVSLEGGEGRRKRPVVTYDQIDVATPPFAEAA